MKKEDLINLLNDFINEEFENEKGKKTLRSYKQEITYFLNWLLDDVPLSKSILIEFKAHLKEKFKPNTQNHYIVVINKFLSYCNLNDLKLKKVKIQQKFSLNDLIEEQEHKRMLRWAKKMDMIDMYYIIKLFAESGIRVIELREFTVEKLDWRMEIYNKGKYREIINPSDLVRELKHYCKERNIVTGYIFKAPKNKDNPLPVSTIWERLKRIAKKAKINPRKIHPHAWRHLYAIRAKAAGVDLDELMDLMGHNNMATTAIYTRTSSKDKRKKIERMKKL